MMFLHRDTPPQVLTGSNLPVLAAVDVVQAFRSRSGNNLTVFGVQYVEISIAYKYPSQYAVVLTGVRYEAGTSNHVTKKRIQILRCPNNL